MAVHIFPPRRRAARPRLADAAPRGSTPGEADAGTAGDPRRGRRVRRALWAGTKFVAGAPFAVFPLGRIVRGGRFIGALASDLRRGAPPPRVVPRSKDGVLDRAATAHALGLTERELDVWFARRRRQTAGVAYFAFALGWAAVLAWMWRLLHLDWAGQRLWAALQFAPACLALFLTAFYQAYLNWQIRTGVLGSAGDYLRSPEPFWPRF